MNKEHKSFWCDHNGPFVETVAGTVRGYKLDELYIFHGIKYADAKRFEMPTPVKHHEGIEDAFTYGPVAPTVNKPRIGPSKAHALDPCFRYNFWPEDEACQYVNVWTRSLDENAKRPVMVWIHGGGFAGGSSVEQHSYDPSNLASENDIVVVSMNHRLNILGFTDMSEYGEKFAESRNLGMADLVECLRWIQANIAKFGGDPGNVTIFGQSGGGGKCQALMQIPAAKDLFHKVILQSGILYPYYDEEQKLETGKIVARALVEELGLKKEEVADKIGEVPLEELYAAYRKVAAELRAKGINPDFCPVKDDYYLGHPATCGLSEKNLNTPVMAGSCAAELYHVQDEFGDYHMPLEYKMERLNYKFGEHTDEMIDIFKKAYPDDDLLNLYHMDYSLRRANIEYLDAKSAKASVKCYSYVLDYTFKFLGGMPTFHGADLPMVFNNTDTVLCCVEPGAKKLGMQMSRAWANFAKYGDPNHGAMPQWLPYTPEHQYTMVFGENCRLGEAFDRELIFKHYDYVAPEKQRLTFFPKRRAK